LFNLEVFVLVIYIFIFNIKNVRSLSEFVSCNITIFYPYRRGTAYFTCIDINKASLSKLGVSLEYLAKCPGFR